VSAEDERIPEIVRTWERVSAVLPESDPADPDDPSVNLDTLAAIAHAKWRGVEALEARLARLEEDLRRAKQSRAGVYEDKLNARERLEVAEMRLAAAQLIVAAREGTEK